MNRLTTAALSVIWLLPLASSPAAAEDAAAPPTELYVRTVPTGATIVVDGKKVGVSDSLFKIEPGVKRIVVELEGYEPGGQEVTIRASRITRLLFELGKRKAIRIPEKLTEPNVAEDLGRPTFRAVLRKLQAEDDLLVDAYRKKDWSAVDDHANELSDTIRDELIGAFHLDQMRAERERLQQSGKDMQAFTSKLRFWRRIMMEIRLVLPREVDLVRTRDLLQAVQDLADDVHDCIRDGKTSQAAARYELLQKAWTELCEFLVPRLSIAEKGSGEKTPCDLWIGPDDIRTFVHSNGGRYLSVSIHSKGEGHIKDVDASFYLGDPEKGGQLIGRGGLSLDAGQTATEAIPWTVTDGEHEVFVRIDPDNSIREQNKRNNAASRPLTIQTLQPARPPATK